MKHRGYYAILGVSKLADQKEIRSAYKKLAGKYPISFFRTPEQNRLFREIKQAYKILSNRYKRDRYDLGLEIFTASDTMEGNEAFINTKEFEEFCLAWENCLDMNYSDISQKRIKRMTINLALSILLICSIIAIYYIITNLSGSF